MIELLMVLIRCKNMGYSNQFFKAIKVDPNSVVNIRSAAKTAGIPLTRFKYYNEKNLVPTGNDLKYIEDEFGVTELELMVKMGRVNHAVLDAIQDNSESIIEILKDDYVKARNTIECGTSELVLETPLGKLYEGDCLHVMSQIESDSVDLIFADPPFNLSKLYPSLMDDNIKSEKYLEWSEQWIAECIRILKPGGAFFTWNLPQWNSKLTGYLHSRLTFRHWIATDIKYSLPIQSRLYPSHYSLLYFINGEKPNTFKSDRMAMQTCPKCFDDLKDYGGYKHKMNPHGVSLTDVWNDIPPVRHAKYKKREGANELSIKLLDRVIEMATKEGDLVFDPFGGSGTTYAVSEIKNRRWIGAELGPCDVIIDRCTDLNEERIYLNSIRESINELFPPKVNKERVKRGLWTYESEQKRKFGKVENSE
jgi:site-specific DNA-methyltransferase (adenine-specific)